MEKVSTSGGTRRHLFGDVALVVFLLAQVLDGALTYIGVTLYGPNIEGNPVVAWLMSAVGDGPGLATAKITAGVLGIALHMSAVHKAVAFLAAFYMTVAVVPWIAVLFVF